MAKKLTEHEQDLIQRAQGAIHTMVMAEALMHGTEPLVHIPTETDALEGMVHAVETLGFASEEYPGATPMEAVTDLFLSCVRMIRRSSPDAVYPSVLSEARGVAGLMVRESTYGLRRHRQLWLDMIVGLGNVAQAVLAVRAGTANDSHLEHACCDLAALCVQYAARILADRDVTIAQAEAEGEEDDWVRTCRVCGCTDDDCSGCIERTGEPCHWVDQDLCSACADSPAEEGGEG